MAVASVYCSLMMSLIAELSKGGQTPDQLPEDTSHDGYELKSMDMERFIYQTCGWDMKSTYRIRGIAVPDRDMVVFDLTTAYRVQEGHLVG